MQKTHLLHKPPYLTSPCAIFTGAVLSFLLITLFLLAPLPAYAKPENNVQVDLISSHQKITPGQSFYLALKLSHDKHWHTYWTNPGDSGQAIKITWDEKTPVTTSDILWPTPEIIPTPPLVTYGYEGVVYIPMRATLPADFSAQNITLNAQAKWLECKDICLPAQKDISLNLEVGMTVEKNRDDHKAIENTLLERLPQSTADWEMSATYGADKLELTFAPPPDRQKPKTPLPTEEVNNADIHFLPFKTGIIENSAPQNLSYNPQTNTYTLQVKRNDFTQNAPEVLSGILLYDKHKSLKFSSLAHTGDVHDIKDDKKQTNYGFLIALGLALLGGLILNLMPCVLPILALKITHLVSHAQKQSPWQHGIAFAIGVISTFMVLAGVLIALQAGGQALGWGFQLQNPLFVLIICVILLIVALDLFGIFEIGTGLTRLGGKAEQVDGKLGSFFVGILATVVATPCTAPFMGSAMAFTLGKPAGVILAVFAMLGVGLSAPYVLLTTFPKCMGFIPKPGPWMVTFKQILGFPILATILWLVWVLGGQVGHDGMLISLGVLLVVAFAVWLWGRFGQSLTSSSRKSRLIMAISLLLISGAFYLGVSGLRMLEDVYTHNTTQAQQTQHVPFRPGLAEERQQQGKASFVIFTADWCITCKINEQTVLNTTKIQQAFKEKDIGVIVADWTRQDDDITRALKKHGRASVPFYLYYPPEYEVAPQPLPELLTQDRVLRTINGNE